MPFSQLCARLASSQKGEKLKMFDNYTDSELHQFAHRCFDLLPRQDDDIERLNMYLVMSRVWDEITRRVSEKRSKAREH